MKCIQRMCSRTKNLQKSGYCNICDDLMENLKKKYENKEKQKTFQRVELDLKLLIDTQNKLVSGKSVEPNVVNTLLLGGITNILCQSDEFENALERVKVLERENIENKLRLESLEHWLLKLNDKMQETNENIETLGTKDSTQLKEQMKSFARKFAP